MATDRELVESALMAEAKRLLALADELGVGAVHVYADPEGVGFVAGAAWPGEGGEEPLVSFGELVGEVTCDG